MEWVKGKIIGHGSFATVTLAKPTSQASPFPPLMALKSCGLSHSASLINEKSILTHLQDCPEIIRCFGDCFTVENGVSVYNIALEYASGGSLDYKLKSSGNFRLPEVRRYTKSILNGLRFIHRSGFVHCDIKLQNILLVSGDGNAAVKIADFGLAKRAAAELESKCEIRGTPMYMAPETVTGGEQGPPSDIWALGCLVAEMVTGKPAWTCSDVGGLFMKIGIGAEIPEIPGKLAGDGKDFLEKCFMKDPEKRWTAEMLLNHPFVNNVSSVQETENQTTSISPRDPFDFPDWESEQPWSMTTFSSPEFDSEVEISPETSPEVRLREVVTDQRPNWSVSSSWVTVR